MHKLGMGVRLGLLLGLCQALAGCADAEDPSTDQGASEVTAKPRTLAEVAAKYADVVVGRMETDFQRQENLGLGSCRMGQGHSVLEAPPKQIASECAVPEGTKAFAGFIPTFDQQDPGRGTRWEPPLSRRGGTEEQIRNAPIDFGEALQKALQAKLPDAEVSCELAFAQVVGTNFMIQVVPKSK